MKITHQGDLSILDLDSDELGRAIRAYVQDHLPTEGYAALSLPELRPLRYAEVGLLGDVYVSGRRIDMCGARVVARRQSPLGETPPSIPAPAPRVNLDVPVSADSLEVRHICALAHADRITLGDAVVAAGLREPSYEDTRRACRARVASVWNDFLERGYVCSISWRVDEGRAGQPGPPWGRAVVVVHGDSSRDIHSSPDLQDRRRATKVVERWASNSDLIIVDDGEARP